MNIDGGYCVIPNSVILDNRLTPNQKILYGVISSLCAKRGYCRACNTYLGDILGVSKRRISEGVNKLVELGYLLTEEKDNKRVILLKFVAQGINKDELVIDDEKTTLDVDENETKDIDGQSGKDKEDGEQLFDKFWNEYPKKVGKKKVETKFKRLKKEDKELAISMLSTWKKTRQWQDKQYIPNPETYLNKERYRDEVTEDMFVNKRSEGSTRVNTVTVGKEEPKKERKKFGKYVELSDEEYNSLVYKFGESHFQPVGMGDCHAVNVIDSLVVDNKIKKMDEYCGNTGARYESYYEKLIIWLRRDGKYEYGNWGSLQEIHDHLESDQTGHLKFRYRVEFGIEQLDKIKKNVGIIDTDFPATLYDDYVLVVGDKYMFHRDYVDKDFIPL